MPKYNILETLWPFFFWKATFVIPLESTIVMFFKNMKICDILERSDLESGKLLVNTMPNATQPLGRILSCHVLNGLRITPHPATYSMTFCVPRFGPFPRKCWVINFQDGIEFHHIEIYQNHLFFLKGKKMFVLCRLLPMVNCHSSCFYTLDTTICSDLVINLNTTNVLFSNGTEDLPVARPQPLQDSRRQQKNVDNYRCPGRIWVCHTSIGAM